MRSLQTQRLLARKANDVARVAMSQHLGGTFSAQLVVICSPHRGTSTTGDRIAQFPPAADEFHGPLTPYTLVRARGIFESQGKCPSPTQVGDLSERLQILCSPVLPQPCNGSFPGSRGGHRRRSQNGGG